MGIEVKNMTKLLEQPILFSEADMASSSTLNFYEVWVIENPEGLYVCAFLKNKKIVEYCSNKEDAEFYKTYEEASLNAKTLDMTVQKGHRIRRFITKKTQAKVC